MVAFVPIQFIVLTAWPRPNTIVGRVPSDNPPCLCCGAIFSGKATTDVGIVANVLVFGLLVPMIGLILSLVSVVFLAIWYILIARRLFQLR